MSDNTNEEVQPQRSLERTMDIVPEILVDPEFSKEVARHHGWLEDTDQTVVALLFLTGRFQWAIDLLNRRTITLKTEVDGNTRRVVDLEDKVFGNS